MDWIKKDIYIYYIIFSGSSGIGKSYKCKVGSDRYVLSSYGSI